MVEKTKKACLSVFNLLTIVLVCVLGCLAVALAFLVKIAMVTLSLVRDQSNAPFAHMADRQPRQAVAPVEYRLPVTELRASDKKAS